MSQTCQWGREANIGVISEICSQENLSHCFIKLEVNTIAWHACKMFFFLLLFIYLGAVLFHNCSCVTSQRESVSIPGLHLNISHCRLLPSSLVEKESCNKTLHSTHPDTLPHPPWLPTCYSALPLLPPLCFILFSNHYLSLTIASFSLCCCCNHLLFLFLVRVIMSETCMWCNPDGLQPSSSCSFIIITLL